MTGKKFLTDTSLHELVLADLIKHWVVKSLACRRRVDFAELVGGPRGGIQGLSGVGRPDVNMNDSASALVPQGVTLDFIGGPGTGEDQEACGFPEFSYVGGPNVPKVPCLFQKNHEVEGMHLNILTGKAFAKGRA